MFVDLQGQRVARAVTIGSKGPKGDPHRAPIPMGAVGIGDEAQLVDPCNERAEEEEINESDKGG